MVFIRSYSRYPLQSFIAVTLRKNEKFFQSNKRISTAIGAKNATNPTGNCGIKMTP